MNKAILFIGICMVLGCSNREYSTSTNDTIAKEKAPITISLEDAYKALILEKIQDHIDTEKLQDQYPNFKQPIDTTTSLHINHQETIQDITLLDTIIQDDTSTTDIRTIITYTSNKKDTIIATIARTKVILDDEEIISSKVILRTPEK
ncbi:hypothetical protein [uncultured Dokdonia sp.]|uniref:hypothetical protein n=1 Tax=uncultured Dokdonia sp. TaxID=575653 RepID=UPI002637ECA7|nr:hypothetical protein [uncultured Dokdonia sp.]